MKNIIVLIFCLACYYTSAGQLANGQSVSTNCGLTIGSLDITSTGTLIVSGDDVSGPFSLPFHFSVSGGVPVNVLVAATNGYISDDITDSGPDLSNDCPIPASPSTGGGSRMYVLHDDLESDIYGQALSVPHPSGSAFASYVIFYDKAFHWGADPLINWQMAIVFWSNGDFAYVYGPGNPDDGSSSTTGVQNSSATLGTPFVPCNTPGQGFGTSLTSICVLSNPVPALGEWAMIILAISLLCLAVVAIRHRNTSFSPNT